MFHYIVNCWYMCAHAHATFFTDTERGAHPLNSKIEIENKNAKQWQKRETLIVKAHQFWRWFFKNSFITWIIIQFFFKHLPHYPFRFFLSLTTPPLKIFRIHARITFRPWSSEIVKWSLLASHFMKILGISSF